MLEERHYVNKTIFGILLLCVVASAGPITFTEQATHSGSLGGVNFANSLITIVLNGDTSTVFMSSAGVFIDFGTATVTVAGIGTATFTDEMEAFSDENSGAAGIADHNNSVQTDTITMFTDNSAFTGYFLEAPIGPLTGLGGFTGISFPTTSGAFVEANVGGNSTFSASAASTAPEPASHVLLAIGFACIFAVHWFARKDHVAREATTRGRRGHPSHSFPPLPPALRS
jgi:hypothetical protein